MKGRGFSIFLVLIANQVFGILLEDPSSDSGTLSDGIDALGLPHEEIKSRMIKLFSKIDLNGDGILDLDELDIFNHKTIQIVNDIQLDGEMDMIDKNKDGYIDLEELESAFATEAGMDTLKYRDGLSKRFTAADKDHDGRLNKQEMGLLLNPGRDEDLLRIEISEILAAHDKNGDGLISLKEYKSARSEDDPDESGLEGEFKPFDTDNDGFLSEQELRLIYKEETANELETDLEDVRMLIGNKPIDIKTWMSNINELATSSLTDHGEILRFPSEYSLDIGKDIGSQEEQETEDIKRTEF